VPTLAAHGTPTGVTVVLPEQLDVKPLTFLGHLDVYHKDGRTKLVTTLSLH